MEFVLYICLAVMLVCGVMAVTYKSMTKSAIALAVASAALGIVMYTIGAVWAAVFEISVCSGLVTVVFISAISLSKTRKNELEKVFDTKNRMAYLPLTLIIGGIALIIIALAINFELPSGAAEIQTAQDFKHIFWNIRQTDVWGLIVVVLTGAVAISVLFKERDKT